MSCGWWLSFFAFLLTKSSLLTSNAGLNAGRISLRPASGAGSALPRLVPRSAAVAEVSALPTMTDEERAALAQKLGYRSIGKELPDSVTLQDVIKSMPEEVRQRGNNEKNSPLQIRPSSISPPPLLMARYLSPASRFWVRCIKK